MLQVFVGQVVLNLGDQLLDELGIRGLPALLLQLPSTGPGAAVCQEQRRTSGSVAQFHLPKRQTVTTFPFLSRWLRNVCSAACRPWCVRAPHSGTTRTTTPGARPRHRCRPGPDTTQTSPSEGRKVTSASSHTEYGEVTRICCFTQFTRTGDGGRAAWPPGVVGRRGRRGGGEGEGDGGGSRSAG